MIKSAQKMLHDSDVTRVGLWSLLEDDVAIYGCIEFATACSFTPPDCQLQCIQFARIAATN